MPADIKQILANNKYLTGQTSDWRSYFQDLADFCLPRKAWITTIKTKGERLKFNYLYDSVAIRALKTMSSGFHNNLTNPSSKWFGLQTRNLRFMKDHDVKIWFHEVEEQMYSVINASNFDTTAQEFYTDIGCFGTSPILTLEDFQDEVRYTSVPVEQINLEEDAAGRVCAVYRNFKLTAMQAFMLWGDKAGKNVLDSLDDKPFIEFEFLHYVGNRHRRDVTKQDNLNMPWESVWLNKSGEHLIEEGGFHEFPYAVGRFWKDANDVFGFSPAMDVLADIKLLNAGKRTTMRRAMKETDPPIEAPSKGYMLPFNFNPAAVNYRDPKLPADIGIKPLIWNSNFQISYEFLKEIKDSIEQGFYVPLFRTLSDVNKNMTVPEVQRRIAENMGLLGSVIGRFIHEVWNPLLLRTFGVLYRSGALPPPPPMIQGQEFDIVYLSPLAKAQRMSEMNTIGTFLQSLGLVGQIKPEVFDKVDEDKTVDLMADISGVNPVILRDSRQIDAIRAQRNQTIQQQMRMEAIHKGAEIAKTGAEVAKTGAQAQAVAT